MNSLNFTPNAVMVEWTGGQGQSYFIVKAAFSTEVNRVILDGGIEEITEEEYNQIVGESFLEGESVGSLSNNGFSKLNDDYQPIDWSNKKGEDGTILIPSSFSNECKNIDTPTSKVISELIQFSYYFCPFLISGFLNMFRENNNSVGLSIVGGKIKVYDPFRLFEKKYSALPFCY